MKHMTQKVEVLMGADGIKMAYELSLTHKKLDIVCLSRDYEQVLGGWFDKVYSRRLYGPGMKTREVLPKSETQKGSVKKPGHDVRYIEGHDTSESDLIITPTEVTIVSYNLAAPFALVISDMEVVKSHSLQFDIFWKSLKS